MREADKRAALCTVGASAHIGLLQGLNDSVETNLMTCMVAVHGESGSVFFSHDADCFKLEGLIFGNDAMRKLHLDTSLVADLVANLTPGEIVDYMDMALAGKNPQITDYVEEVLHP